MGSVRSRSEKEEGKEDTKQKSDAVPRPCDSESSAAKAEDARGICLPPKDDSVSGVSLRAYR